MSVERTRHALERRIRRAGLGAAEIEERLGWEPGSLEQALSGQTEMRFAHVAGALVVLDLHPTEFFSEIHGLPPVPPEQREGAEHPSYELSSQLVRWSSLRVLVWECKEKGVFTEEEAEKLLANLERQAPAI